MHMPKYFFKGLLTIIIGVFKTIKMFFLGIGNLLWSIPYRFVMGFQYLFFTKKSIKETVSTIMMAISLFIYFGSIFILSRWINQNRKLNNLTNDIINSTNIVDSMPKESGVRVNLILYPVDGMPQAQVEQPTYYPSDYYDYMSSNYENIDFTELLKKNNDTVGWIKVEGTKVNYPIVQTKDNFYYLTHAFDKSSNGGGWIFGDHRNDMKNLKKNTIIYGHNLTNKTLFGSLPSVLKSNWLNKPDNHYIKLSTLKYNMVWKIFSVYSIEPEVYYIRTQFESLGDHQNFLDTIKKRSIRDFNETLTTDDYVLTLSTCDDLGTKRVVVHAKLIGIKDR